VDTKNIKWMDSLPEHLDDVLYYVQVEGRAPFVAGLTRLYWYDESVFYEDGIGASVRVEKLAKVRTPKSDKMTDKSVYGVDGMTRQEFERDLRVRYAHDNVRAHERGIPINLEFNEKDIQERVALNYGKANCSGCGAFDVGMSEVTFDHECIGCQARMRAANGLGPTPKPEYVARVEPIEHIAAPTRTQGASVAVAVRNGKCADSRGIK
jgi:hypothetical protein